MKMMKSVLAVVVAICLMMCLAVSAYATEPTETVTATTEATTATTEEATAATEEAVEETEAEATEESVGIEEGTGDPTDAVIDMNDLLEAAGDETGAITEDEAEEEVAEEEEHDHTHGEEVVEEEVVEDVSSGKKALRTVVIILQVIASLGLILVVLAQSGKESGLSGALSGNSDSYMNKNGAGSLDKKLAKATKWVALAWVVITLVLFLLYI